MYRTEYLFDGTTSERPDEFSFITFRRFDHDKWIGCDVYADGTGGWDVEDWQDGNGLMAHTDYTDDDIIRFAEIVDRGDKIDGLVAAD